MNFCFFILEKKKKGSKHIITFQGTCGIAYFITLSCNRFNCLPLLPRTPGRTYVWGAVKCNTTISVSYIQCTKESSTNKEQVVLLCACSVLCRCAWMLAVPRPWSTAVCSTVLGALRVLHPRVLCFPSPCSKGTCCRQLSNSGSILLQRRLKCLMKMGWCSSYF